MCKMCKERFKGEEVGLFPHSARTVIVAQKPRKKGNPNVRLKTEGTGCSRGKEEVAVFGSAQCIPRCFVLFFLRSFLCCIFRLSFCSSALPLSGILHDKRAHNAGGQADAAEDGDAEQPLLGDLVVDELAEVGGLEVGGLLVDEEVVVAAGLAVVAELVVAEGEVVEALAAALGGDAEDFGQEADAELLVAAVVGLDEALGGGQREFALEQDCR